MSVACTHRIGSGNLNILVIGGTGFLGLALAKRLTAEGHKFTLYHRGVNPLLDYNQFQGDMEDASALHECINGVCPDCIIHLYAMNSTHINVLKAALDGRSVRVVVISSADVYKAFEVVNKLTGAPLQPVPFREDAPLRDLRNFIPDYEKIDVESAASGLNAICVRLGMVYGENDKQKRFGDVLEAMRAGNSITIPQNLANWRSCYIGVNNAANGILRLAESGTAGEAYNLAGDEILTEYQWRQKIAKLIDWRGKIDITEDVDDLLNYNQDLILDTSKIRLDIGYRDIFLTEDELRGIL